MERYDLTSKDLSIVKKAARYMRLDWKSLAARASIARRLIDLVASHGVADGCEKFALDNPDNRPVERRVADSWWATLNAKAARRLIERDA